MRIFSRKSESDTDPPNPPAKAEILEDLETFSLHNINLTKSHKKLGEGTLDATSTSDITLNTTEAAKTEKRDGKESESKRQLDEWWTTFERFLSDIDRLEINRKQFETKKTNLSKLDETITLMADDIQTRITDSLEKSSAEIPESEQDLK